MTAPLGNVKASVPPEQLKAKMNPGDVSFLGFERKDNVFTVTFAWIDRRSSRTHFRSRRHLRRLQQSPEGLH